ncbi:hypothetical protein Tco_1009571, partial [Tanacetum coccineum]
MLGKTPNKVYDLFLTGLGYKNPERLKKAITTQPKMYDGEKLHSVNLKIDSPDLEETLENMEEIENEKQNVHTTSTNGSKSKAVTSNLPIPKMPKESKFQNSLREFYKTDVIPMSTSLSKNLKELKEELNEEVHEMLNIFEPMEQKVDGKSSKENILQKEIDRLLEVSFTSEIQNYVLISIEKQKNELLNGELEKSSNDSKDIQANLLKRIKILEYDFKRSQAQ